MVIVWSIIGVILGTLLAISALMDRATKKRRAATPYSGDISREIRESKRDAEVIASSGFGPLRPDIGWTSWSRRNHSDQTGNN